MGAYDTVMVTAGGGYRWSIGRHFYINPWGAVHQRVAGDTTAQVGGRTYTPRAFVPEASVKLGWQF